MEVPRRALHQQSEPESTVTMEADNNPQRNFDVEENREADDTALFSSKAHALVKQQQQKQIDGFFDKKEDSRRGDGANISTDESASTSSRVSPDSTSAKSWYPPKPKHPWRVPAYDPPQQRRWERVALAMCFLLVAAIVAVLFSVVLQDKDDEGSGNQQQKPLVPIPSSYFARPETVEWRLQQEFRNDEKGLDFAKFVVMSADAKVIYIGKATSAYGLLYHFNATLDQYVLHTHLEIEHFLLSKYNQKSFAALSGNGQHLAIRTDERSVTTFDYDVEKDEWAKHDQLLVGEDSPYNDDFGYSFDFDYHGNVLAIGAPKYRFPAPFSGKIRLYKRTKAHTWTLVAQITGHKLSDEVGKSVLLSADGTRLMNGCELSGGVTRMWQKELGHHHETKALQTKSRADRLEDWEPLEDPVQFDDLGYMKSQIFALGADGNVVAIGHPYGMGRIFVLEFAEGNWHQRGEPIKGEGAAYTCLSADGNLLVHGVSPYQYDRSTDSWTPMQKIPFQYPVGTKDEKGRKKAPVRCSADGRTIVLTQLGTEEKDSEGLGRPGSVQVFRAVDH